MEKVELLLDAPMLERTRRVAQARGYTVEELLEQLVQQLDSNGTTDDPVLGSFADEPGLIDQVTDDAMLAREAQVLERPDE